MLNIVRVTIEGLPGSGKSQFAAAIKKANPKGFLVMNSDEFASEQKIIDYAKNIKWITTLVIITETTPKAN
jgi:uridine kinase